MRKTMAIAGTLCVVFMLAPATAASPVKIADTSADETSPAIADGWVAWSVHAGNRYVIRVVPSGGNARTVASPYDAFAGGFAKHRAAAQAPCLAQPEQCDLEREESRLGIGLLLE